MSAEYLNHTKQLVDAEDALDACSAALALIPVWEIRRGHRWLPSDEALDLICTAKKMLDKYSRRYLANDDGK